jgi:hypothetical protein
MQRPVDWGDLFPVYSQNQSKSGRRTRCAARRSWHAPCARELFDGSGMRNLPTPEFVLNGLGPNPAGNAVESRVERTKTFESESIKDAQSIFETTLTIPMGWQSSELVDRRTGHC